VKRRELLASLPAAALVGGCTDQVLQRVQANRPHQINVRSAPYNAMGDGSADDTAAFASACQAAGVNGTVIVPPGTYIANNLALNFAGQLWVIQQGATLKSKAADASPAARVSGPGVTITGGGTIDGSRSAQTTGDPDGIICEAPNVTLDGITIQNCLSNGILFAGNWSGSTVTRCRFSGIAYAAICANDSTADITGVRISGNWIDQFDTMPRAGQTLAAPGGINFWNSSSQAWRGFKIVDNFVRLYSYVNAEYANINGGICLHGLSDFVIASNVFMGGGMPVTLPDAVAGTITGNHIEGWSVFGVELAGVTDGAPYKVAVTGNSLIDTDPRSRVHHSEAAIPIGGLPASHVTIAGNIFEQVSPGGSPAVNIGVGAAMGTVHHITVTGNTLRKTGTGGGIVVNKSPDVTIADNIFDFGGVNSYAVWLATDNAATPVTLMGQVITGNQFLNYGAYSAILYGQTSGHPGVVDYAILANNLFRGGKAGITAQGGAILGPHAVRVNNVGP
jgi:Right handed beta helix region/Pectate lyase superfamily protein